MQTMLYPRLSYHYKFVVLEDFFILYNIQTSQRKPFFLHALYNSTSNKFQGDRSYLVGGFCSGLLAIGQQCKSVYARKSIVQFGIRESSIAGVRGTIRKRLLWSFLDKLLMFVVPKMDSNRSITSRHQTDKKNKFDNETRHVTNTSHFINKESIGWTKKEFLQKPFQIGVSSFKFSSQRSLILPELNELFWLLDRSSSSLLRKDSESKQSYGIGINLSVQLIDSSSLYIKNEIKEIGYHNFLKKFFDYDRVLTKTNRDKAITQEKNRFADLHIKVTNKKVQDSLSQHERTLALRAWENSETRDANLAEQSSIKSRLYIPRLGSNCIFVGKRFFKSKPTNGLESPYDMKFVSKSTRQGIPCRSHAFLTKRFKGSKIHANIFSKVRSQFFTAFQIPFLK